MTALAACQREVDLIKLIRHLQKRHRLSLSEIREIMAGRGENPDASLQLELNDLVFGPHGQGKEELLDRKAFCSETGLSDRQLEELIKARLINPLQKNRFDQEDLRTGRALSRGLSSGGFRSAT